METLNVLQSPTPRCWTWGHFFFFFVVWKTVIINHGTRVGGTFPRVDSFWFLDICFWLEECYSKDRSSSLFRRPPLPRRPLFRRDAIRWNFIGKLKDDRAVVFILIQCRVTTPAWDQKLKGSMSLIDCKLSYLLVH